MMRFSNETLLPMRGDLRILRRDAQTQDLLSVWEKKNVITYAGTEALVKLMAPNAAFGVNVQEENQLFSMRFGTNSTSPQRTDTALAAEGYASGSYVRIQFADVNRIVGVSGTVEYTATMTTGYGNGLTYREAGLFTRGTLDDPQLTSAAIMFSRQVYPDQVKTSAVELEFRWRLTLTV
jgi:hypothetical protein